MVIPVTDQRGQTEWRRTGDGVHPGRRRPGGPWDSGTAEAFVGGRLHCGNPGRIAPEGMVWCAPVTAFGAERLTNPARPRRVVVDPIPRTATGTIRKAELRGAT